MSRSRPFYPPQQNPLLTRLVQSISPLSACLFYQLNLQIDPADLEKLKALGSDRYILLPNHSQFADGIVLFLLSTRLGELFHYLVAYEVFQGGLGKFLQTMGAYSVRRGVADRASVAYSLEFLRQPAARLVIFPEGGCSFQNDTVMPFRTGAIQLPLQAMNQWAKQGDIPNVYLVPVSLKYRYTQPMEGEIARSLDRLETALKVSPPAADFYARLRAVSEQTIANIEQEYGLNGAETEKMDWNQRISRIKTHAIACCEQQLNLAPVPKLPDRERAYKIQHVLASRAEEVKDIDLDFIYNTTTRLLNFDAMYDGYVAAAPTQERFLDTLTRLEREVFAIDIPAPKGHRNAIVRIGDPVNLKDYVESYRENRTDTVERLAQQMQEAVQHLLSLTMRFS
ncbi:MAG: 1-acyl-sn-glycerol-3-phosphate acyltransferase [Cyanobacteriota bacterium]|nr:1-acyl-sn-glycerol-3-phosphate acyltransferase [Cyanobacteriota bacterium]